MPQTIGQVPLTLNKYQQHARKTALYPGRNSVLGIMYCALKLNGEAGEFAEHLGKAIRDDELISKDINRPSSLGWENEFTEPRYSALIKEVGDCLWYLAMLCDEFGIGLEDVAYINLQKLADRTARDKLQGEGDER